uniref:Uncharacterized protein n=1 Tax=Moniliophthora roreri TaxID=221103 RepID=A0A0W0G191_MONRR
MSMGSWKYEAFGQVLSRSQTYQYFGAV